MTRQLKKAHSEDLHDIFHNNCSLLNKSLDISQLSNLSFEYENNNEVPCLAENIMKSDCNSFNPAHYKKTMEMYGIKPVEEKKMMDATIPGTLSNLTLECLSPFRNPFKTITSKKKADQNPFGAGTIGEVSAQSLIDSFNACQNMTSQTEYETGDSNPYFSSSSCLQAYKNLEAAELLKRLGVQHLNNDFSTSSDLWGNKPSNSFSSLSPSDPHQAAKLYKHAATLSEPTHTWSGQLTSKHLRNPVYSFKVFLGGVPWDITESALQISLRSYGPVRVEWPGRNARHPRCSTKTSELPVGYVYILFEAERSVKSLLQACKKNFSNSREYFFQISSKRMKSKEVQVVPWVLSSSNYFKEPSQPLEPYKTVFVGALHGMITAEALAHIFNDLFGNVIYTGIDTDKHKYPIGSGRVTFSSYNSYYKAVTAAFVEVKTHKFFKKIQIDPYLVEAQCSVCETCEGAYFCRHFQCFNYFCRPCWQVVHCHEATSSHKPLMRNHKLSASPQVVDF